MFITANTNTARFAERSDAKSRRQTHLYLHNRDSGTDYHFLNIPYTYHLSVFSLTTFMPNNVDIGFFAFIIDFDNHNPE